MLQTEAKTRLDQEEGNRHSAGDFVFIFSLVSFPATNIKVLDYLQYEVQWSDDSADISAYRFAKKGS